MKNFYDVTATGGTKPLNTEVTDTIVYVRFNIKPFEEYTKDNKLFFKGWKYDEIQYTKDEYIQLMADRQNLESQLLTDLDINTQESSLRQEVESEMITQHDMDILLLSTKLEETLKRLEVLENEKAKRKRGTTSQTL